MHAAGEEEGFRRPQVPAAAGGEHVAVFPEVYGFQEVCTVERRFIVEQRGTHEDAVGVHIHGPLEGEDLRFGVVRAVVALDDLTFRIAHGGAVAEVGHRVASVVVQEMRAEGVVLVVFELHHSPAALHQVLVDEVVHLVGREDGALLDDLHVAFGVDHPVVHAPQGGVADEVGAVVHECGVHALAVGAAALFDEFQGLGLDETHQAVPLLPVLGSERQRARKQQREGYRLTFEAHPAREKSQSPKSGSITI